MIDQQTTIFIYLQRFTKFNPKSIFGGGQANYRILIIAGGYGIRSSDKAFFVYNIYKLSSWGNQSKKYNIYFH